MNELFREIVLCAPADPSLRELITYELHRLGFTGFLEDDENIRSYIPEKLWSESTQKKLEAALNMHHFAGVGISGVNEIQNENWNRLWEDSIQPIEVADRFIITPSWHRDVEQGNKIVLIIDPKMSFGTGYHESTRLALQLISRYEMHNSAVLDVGTGTGVLAIAAAKVGARSVVGIDIDEWSFINAEENVARNECEDIVRIKFGSVEHVTETGFDFIFANITRKTIIDLLPLLLERMSKQGILLLSGLLEDDRAIMEETLRFHHCTVLSVVKENEWIGIVAGRDHA